MGLSPEERKKIYQEEKARIEAEERQETAAAGSAVSLAPNVAGLLCYLLGWITGIIFLIIEQKNRFVRFHAVQSIIVFGALTMASALLGRMPFIGILFSIVIGIVTFILWLILMAKAYQGEQYKIPIAGDLAEKLLSPPDTVTPDTATEDSADDVAEKETDNQAAIPGKPDAAGPAKSAKIEQRIDRFFRNSRAARVTASSMAIAWSLILLVFFTAFHKFIAYYQPSTSAGVTTWTRYPFLTDDYYLWLPILLTTLTLSIVGHIILIIHDRYWLRQSALIFLNVLAILTVVNLLIIFPFDFFVIPSIAIANLVSVVLRIALIGVAIGLTVGSIVIFIQMITNVIKATSPPVSY